ncbi:MAG: putative metallopeptidase [Bacillota bacterium]
MKIEKVKPYRVIPINDSPRLKKQEEKNLAREAAISFSTYRTDFSSRYRLAPGVKAVADPIITSYHPHLREASIAYLLRRGTWKSRGQVITGKAAIAPEQWRLLSGCDLVLIINETVWQVLGDKGREVLLDHEISHFTPPTTDKDGTLRWAVKKQRPPPPENRRSAPRSRNSWSGRAGSSSTTCKAWAATPACPTCRPSRTAAPSTSKSNAPAAARAPNKKNSSRTWRLPEVFIFLPET